MSDSSNNGAGPSQPSLRDIAEQAYDDLESRKPRPRAPGPEADAPAEEPLASDDRPRDKSGPLGAQVRRPSRVKQSASPSLPIQPRRNQKFPRPSAADPDPAAAQAPRSNQAPEHWSAEDKATFAKLPQEGQAFLLKRHGEMEAEFTRKSQASAGAVQFTQSLAPVFTDRRCASVAAADGT